MEFVPLPPKEVAVRRYVEELWLPYHQDLAAAVDAHELADDVDIVEEELEFRLDMLDAETYELVVAVDPAADADGNSLADGDLAGFVATDINEGPPVFEQPDRLHVGDIYVKERYRGEGLGRELMAHAADRARAEECEAVTLDVDIDNERALAFYETLGFAPLRKQLRIATEDLQP